MRNSSEHARLPGGRTLRRAKRWGLTTLLAALALLLAACQTVPPEPAPQVEPEFDLELELSHLDLPVNEQFRVRFLPPLAKKTPTGDFVSDMALEIRFFNVNPNTSEASGKSLGTTLSTAKRTIVSKRGTFSTIWLSLSLLRERKATQYLRAEIRLPGGPNAPVCNQASEHCLGYLDIYVFRGLWLGRQTVPEGFVPVPALVGVLPMSFKVLEEQTAPPANDPAPDTIDELQGVAGGVLSSVGEGGRAPNCVSAFSQRPGQGLQRVGAGLQRVGAIGGLLLVDQNAFTGSLLLPGQVGDELRTFIADDVEYSAVILIVDDFSEGQELPPALLNGGTPISAFENQISHGALVLHHLKEMGTELVPGTLWSEGKGANGQPYWERDTGPNSLYLQVVNVGRDSTDSIPAAVLAAIEYWADLGVEDFIVNMSFAIVPCSVANDYEAAAGMAALEIDTFEEYLAALADVNGIGETYVPDLDRLVSMPVSVSEDPLLRFVECPVTTPGRACDGSVEGSVDEPDALFHRLMFVASSGNYGNSYALYPAASNFVVSVGSVERTGNGFSATEYSNAAEIAAPGDLFMLETANGQTIGYTGTSFAAPAVSLYLAYDSMQYYERCRTNRVAFGQVPDLATGSYTMLPFYTLDGSVSALASNCLRAG